MANEIKLTIKVDDAGTLNIVAKEAEKTAKATDKVKKSTDSASKAKSNYNKLEKGTAQLGANTTKSFAKQAQVIGSGLVSSYAVLAANIFAITAGFGALSRAFAAEQLKQGLLELGASSGLAMETLSRGLKAATGNALSLEDSMRAVAQITSAGLDPSSIEQFGEIARKTSVALGRDTADSLNRLTRGVTKLEPELLDELGIMVRIDEASEDYARTLGKTAAELTNFEKRQAFMNAVLEEGDRKFGDITVDTSPYDKLAATFKDLTNSVLGFVSGALEPLISLLANSSGLLVGVLVMFAGTLRNQLLGSLTVFAQKSLESAQQLQKLQLRSQKFLVTSNHMSGKLKDLTVAMKNGTAGSKEFAAAINGQVQSQRTNLGLFKKGAISYETYADRVYTAKKAIVEVNVAESRSLQIKSKNTTATVIAAIAEGNRAKAIKLTRIALLRNIKALKIASRSFFSFSGAMATARAGMALTATTAKILGAALLNMIPLIGQIISVAMLLWEGISALKDVFSEETEAEKQYAAQADKTKSLMEELEPAVKKLNLAFLGQSNLFSSLSSEMQSYSNVLRQMSVELRAQQELASTGAQERQSAANIDSVIKNSARLSAAVKKEFGSLDFSDIASKHFGDNRKRTAEALLDFIDSSQLAAQSLAGLGDAFKETNKSVSDYLNTLVKGSNLDRVIDNLENIEKARKSAGGTEDAGIIAFQSVSADTAAFLGMEDHYSAATKKEKELQALREKGQGDGGRARELERHLSLIGTLIAEQGKAKAEQLNIDAKTQANASKLLSEEKKKLNVLNQALVTSENVEAITKSRIALEQEIANQEIDKLESQFTASKNYENDLKAKTESAKRDKEIVQAQANQAAILVNIEKIRGRILSEGEQELKVASAVFKANKNRISVEKEVLSIQQKAFSLQQKAFNLSQSVRKTEMQVGNLASGRGADLSSEQELQLAKEVEERVLATAAKELEMKVKMINLEYDLLGFRLSVLEKEGELAGVKINTSALRETLEVSRQSALQVAALESVNKITTSILGTKKAEKKFNDETDSNTLKNLQSQAAAARLAGNERLAEALQRQATEEKIQQLSRDISNDVLDKEDKILERLQLQQQLKDSAISAAGEGATTSERVRNFGDAGGIEKLDTAKEKIAATRELLTPMIDDLAKLGPEGELVSMVAQGAFVTADAWSEVGKTFKANADGMEKGAAVAAAVGATIGAVAGIMAASSRARVAGIDKEIAAEKKRDGKSKESLAKIAKLERKAESTKRKAFETNKKMMIAQAIASTAAGVVGALGSKPWGPWNFALAGLVAAMGAAQVAVIAGTSYQGGGSGSAVSTAAPTSIKMGKRSNSVDLAKAKTPSGELGYLRGAQGQGGAENFRPAFTGLKYRAAGGSAGMIVGEQGPELFVPETPGTIVPNDEVSTSSTSNISFTINTIDASGVEEMLLSQQGNIIGMIRQASNEYGQEFLEEVDTELYTPSSVGGVRKY